MNLKAIAGTLLPVGLVAGHLLGQNVNYVNSPALSTPPGYSHAVVVEHGRIVYLSGQVGLNAKGVVAGDFRAQSTQAFANLRAALAAKLSDGKLTVIENLALGEAKTKAYRAALNAIDVKRTALIVENSQSLSPALILGVRNLEGVELMLNNEVHPYDLLRYDRAIFSRAALEQLQETLKKTVSKRKQRAKAEVA